MRKKSQKKSTKVTKRSREKYPGLVKNLNTKVRQELIDHDYIDKLNHKEKEFLSNFNEEYVGANFNHKGRKLHRSAESRRQCYNRNNARNRDIHSISSVTGALVNMDFLLDKQAEFSPESLLEIRMYLKENNITMEKFLEKIEQEESLNKKLKKALNNLN